MKRLVPALATSLALALLGGCASAPEEHFYTLSAIATPASTMPRSKTSVSVGPVTLPELVDRPQLVLQRDANRVSILEYQRWAAPLGSTIGQVVAANLTRLLGGARVAAYPQSASTDSDYRVVLDVQSFESSPDTARLEVLWAIRDSKGELVRAGRSTLSEPTGGGDTAALVAAHDRALAALSREIAGFIPANRPASRAAGESDAG